MFRRRVRIPEPKRGPDVPLGLAERWSRACREVFGLRAWWDLPVILAHQEVPSGHNLTVRLPAKITLDVLTAAAERLAAGLDVPNLRVLPDPSSKALARVVIVLRDPLAQPLPQLWPLLDATRVDLWATKVPVGIDEHGRLVALDLTERNVLLGGEPGAGKSVAASMLVAAAALDPTVTLILADGALVELGLWRARADRFVGPDSIEFLDLLEELRGEMNRRLDVLDAAGHRKVQQGDGLPLVVVAIDELAFYLNTGNRKLDEKIETALRDLVARGRKTGIMVVAATQRPSGDVIPTSIRDLFAVRWAFRVTTPDSSDTILGRGWAMQGYNAQSIDVAHRGVGFLLAEGALPVRLRTFYLTDDHLKTLAERAATLRVAEQTGEQGEAA